IVDFATEHGMAIRGHALVWHLQNPPWLSGLSWAELRTALAGRITTLMRRYAGRIKEWDVVNEAMGDDGNLRRSLWLDKLGPGYGDATLLDGELRPKPAFDAFRAALLRR